MQAVVRLGLSAWLSFCLAIGTASAEPAPRQSLGPGLATPGDRSSAVLLVEPVAEKALQRLPRAPVYWRVETFPTLESAKAAEGEASLAVEAWGAYWLFTLGEPGRSSPGGRKVAEVGPAPVPAAPRLLLRVNRASGPPGAKTPVHTHPGSEAFFVLRGQLTQRTSHGVSRVEAGNAMNGHAPGMVMQLESTGVEPLEQLVMFVVDADAPFSSPATFERAP